MANENNKYSEVFERVKNILYNKIKSVQQGNAADFRKNINDAIGTLPKEFDESGHIKKYEDGTYADGDGMSGAVYAMGDIIQVGLSELDDTLADSRAATTDAINATTAANTATKAAIDATGKAINATSDANTATTNANAATTAANAATEAANTATTNAINATSATIEATGNANAATNAARTATDAANTATTNANAATTATNTAITNAVEATTAANTATENANKATTNAINATNDAIEATTNANTATDNANKATDNANRAAGAVDGLVLEKLLPFFVVAKADESDSYPVEEDENGNKTRIDQIAGALWFKVLKDEKMADTLKDFYYTENLDGTFTIEDWKGTLNGEPSTKMIVPDDDRIIF